MRIPFELAETLAAAVDEGTLDAAARRLHITPSAVSQRIKALEEQLGRLLLVRSKPVRATDAGAAVIRLARQAAQDQSQQPAKPRAPRAFQCEQRQNVPTLKLKVAFQSHR